MDNNNQEKEENNENEFEEFLKYISPSDELNFDLQNFQIDNSEDIIFNLQNEKKEEKKEEEKENKILNISEFDLKIKFQNVCSSLEFFNINQQNTKNLKDSLSYISDSKEKLLIIIDNLLNSFIDIFSKLKEENEIKENLINKINNINKNNDDYEKKIFKLKKEILAKENEIGSIINKNLAEKEKIIDNKKTKNLEINNLKNENRKLVNLIGICKNELNKKDNEIERIRKKIDLIQSDYLNNKNNMNKNLTENINTKYCTNYYENNKNNNKIKEFNIELIKLIQIFNDFINKSYFQIIKEKNFEKNSFHSIENSFIKNMNLNNIQSFKENFKNNIEELYKIIIEPILKKSSSSKHFALSYENEDLNKAILQQQNKNSEWYKHCFGQIVKYKFDKNKVISGEDNEDE